MKLNKDFLFWYLNDLFHLEKDIVVISDTDVIHLEVRGFPFYLYIKSLTYAGNPYPLNTTRAQLPRRDEFDSIKNQDAVFLFLGYDVENKVFACWDPKRTKERLNEKQYVSFFSRLNQQESVKEGKIDIAYLQNDFKYVLFYIDDLPNFLLNINEYFPDLQVKPIVIAASDKVQGLLSDVKKDSSVKLLIDELYEENRDVSALTIVSSCIKEFGEFYHRMTLKDWYKIVNQYITQKENSQSYVGELDFSLNSTSMVSEDSSEKTTVSKTNNSKKEFIEDSDYDYENDRVIVGQFLKLLPSQEIGEIVSIATQFNGMRKLKIKMLTGSIREIDDDDYLYIVLKKRYNKDALEENVKSNNSEKYINDIVSEINTHKSQTPPSKMGNEDVFMEEIDYKRLYSVFDNKATSYKYFWFLSIISLAQERKTLFIPYQEIIIRMAAMAWPIVIGSGVELGKQDMLKTYLAEIKGRSRLIKGASGKYIESYIKQHFESLGFNHILSPLLFNVPYRFLSPWIPFTTKDEVIEKSLAIDFKGLYSLNKDGITVNESWWNYIETHCSEICDFAMQSFISYVKQYNYEFRLLKIKKNGWSFIKFPNNNESQSIIEAQPKLSAADRLKNLKKQMQEGASNSYQPEHLPSLNISKSPSIQNNQNLHIHDNDGEFLHFDGFDIKYYGNHCYIYKNDEKVFSSTGRIIMIKGNLYRMSYSYSSLSMNIINRQNDSFILGGRILQAYYRSPLFSLINRENYFESIKALKYIPDTNNYIFEIKSKWYDYNGDYAPMGLVLTALEPHVELANPDEDSSQPSEEQYLKEYVEDKKFDYDNGKVKLGQVLKLISSGEIGKVLNINVLDESTGKRKLLLEMKEDGSIREITDDNSCFVVLKIVNSKESSGEKEEEESSNTIDEEYNSDSNQPHKSNEEYIIVNDDENNRCSLYQNGNLVYYSSGALKIVGDCIYRIYLIYAKVYVYILVKGRSGSLLTGKCIIEAADHTELYYALYGENLEKIVQDINKVENSDDYQINVNGKWYDFLGNRTNRMQIDNDQKELDRDPTSFTNSLLKKNKRWTVREENDLVYRYKNGSTIPRLAIRFGREESEIIEKLKKHGYV